MSSVLLLGDAGALNYVDDAMSEGPGSTFGFCCNCSTPVLHEKEKNMQPIRKAGI